MNPEWIYPEGWDDANMADPAVFHEWQDVVARLNSTIPSRVDDIHPCGCNDCRQWREHRGQPGYNVRGND